jgi:type IV pilus assembly protein PilV
MRKNFFKNRQDGFTMLELTFAMLVLAFGLLGIAGLQIVAINGNSTAKEFTRASGVVTEKIEQFKQGAYDDITSDTDYVVFVDNQPITVSSAPSSGFFMTRVITVTDDTPIENTKTVHVEVSWTDKEKENTQRNIDFETVIANSGIDEG